MINFHLKRKAFLLPCYRPLKLSSFSNQYYYKPSYLFIQRDYCDFSYSRIYKKKKTKDPLSKRIQDLTTSGLIKTANNIQVDENKNEKKDGEKTIGENEGSINNDIDLHSKKFLLLCEKLKTDKANNTSINKPIKKIYPNKLTQSEDKCQENEVIEENVYEKHGFINFEDAFDLSHYYVEEVEDIEHQVSNKIEMLDLKKYQYDIDKDRRKIQTKVDITLANLKKDSHHLSEEELQFWSGSFPWNKRVNKVNKEIFGHNGFRPYQKEAINMANMRRNLFISLATGGGKSLCYQIPCLLEKGSTIIISPLISLIEDQVNSLLHKGLPAIGISSHTQAHELNSLYRSMQDDNVPYKFIFITPERIIQSSKFMEALKIMDKKKNLQRFVIDEAHCISEWGHDFRKDYRKLTILKEEFPLVPITALSASCTPIVQHDILQQLSIENNVSVVQDSFNRPNLWIQIERKTPDYMNDIYNYILNSGYKDSSGIIFALTCGDTERISSFLLEKGIKSIHYHGNLNPLERKKNQQLWMNDEVNVICTTIAFGLGIDKKDVRYVIHSTMPTSIESYYQQIGRAGRDGEKSDCILFYSRNDRTRIEKIIKLNSFSSIHENLERRDYDSDITIVEECSDGFEEELIDYEVSAMKSEKLDDISFFCQMKDDCRRNVLLEYFGELCTTSCGNCDVCKPKEKRKVKSNFKTNISKSKEEVDEIIRKINSNTRFKTSHPLKNIIQNSNSEMDQIFEENDKENEEISNNQDSLHAKIAEIIKIKEERKRAKEIKKAFPSISSIKPKVNIIKQQPIDDYNSTEVSHNIVVNLYKMCEDISSVKGISPRLVLSHQQIKDIAHIKPSTLKELKSIRGIGTKKVMLYGNEILAIVNNV